MLITKVSGFTGKTNTMEIDITEERLDAYEKGHDRLQDVFPDLTPSEREFIMTGITDEEWDYLFKTVDERIDLGA